MLHRGKSKEYRALEEGCWDPQTEVDDSGDNDVYLDKSVEESDVAEILAATIGLFQKVNDVFNPE